jgi:hypothetical protein
MKNSHLLCLTLLLLVFLSACTTLSTPTPTQALEPSPTIGPELARATPLPTFQNPLAVGTPTLPSPASTQASSTAAVTNATPSATTYAVVLVSKNNTLTIRQNPGKGSKAIGSLPYDAKNIHLTGNESHMEDEKWVEIQNTDGSGWVNAAYLTQSISSSFFCNDPQVKTLLASFSNALKTKDAGVFQTLVSPAHGLKLGYLRGGTIANYSLAQVGWLFSSTYPMHWGEAPGSGMAVTGSFSQIILPKLIDVLAGNYALYCNELKVGGASYPVAWPDDYVNINFLSLYRAGSAGEELNWRTWMMGVEYSDSKPTIFALNHFTWEP